MKQALHCILFLLPFLDIHAQDNTKNGLSAQLNGRVNENNIYIFCKGTASKSGLVAQKFNLTDTNITHIGIGYFDGNNAYIFNVFDNKLTTNAFKVDSVSSFLAPHDVYYFSIWECNNSINEFLKFKEALMLFLERKIIFDWAFDLNNGNQHLYCSEFCAKILYSLDSEKYFFKPTITVLNNSFYESVLERKQLIYYPVDFFKQSKHFKKIFETRFINENCPDRR